TEYFRFDRLGADIRYWRSVHQIGKFCRYERKGNGYRTWRIPHSKSKRPNVENLGDSGLYRNGDYQAGCEFEYLEFGSSRRWSCTWRAASGSLFLEFRTIT